LTVLVLFYISTATTASYTLSLHDALPISLRPNPSLDDTIRGLPFPQRPLGSALPGDPGRVMKNLLSIEELTAAEINALLDSAAVDRKSTRLNSSHVKISYAVFCLKKKTTT